MFIKELIIEEFASVTNKKIKLSRDFNLITGANETGKSTVCAFIKFIFYGFVDSKERERYSSLKTANSAGAMIIEHNERVYRIARRAAGRAQTVAVYDESDGSEFTDWRTSAETPGDYFLSIPHQLYTRSLYVSQAGGARLDGGSAEAISNLLLTGDEALNLKRAKKVLDEARKALKLKRGVGGMISDCEKKLAALKQQRDEAINSRRQLEAISIALQNEKKHMEKLNKKLGDASDALQMIKTQKLLAYLKQLDELQATKIKNKILFEELQSGAAHLGFTPDSKYEEELLALKNELSVYEEQVKRNEDRLIELRAKLSAVPPKEYSAYCELGKKEAILPIYQHKLSSFKLFNIIFFLSCFLLAVSVIAIGMQMLNIFKSTGIFIRVLLGISAFGTVLFGILRIFPKKTLSRLNTALYADSVRTVTDICRDCDTYEQKLSTSDLGYLSQLLSDSMKSKATVTERVNSLLALWNKPSVDVALADYRAYVTRLAELRSELDKADNGISIINAYISTYTENEIAVARALPTDTVFSAANDVSEDYVNELKLLLSASEKQCREYEIAVAKGSSHTDIDDINANIEQTEKALTDYTCKYDAITLALEALEQAELRIRKTVSPYLSEHASEYFARITAGRYRELRLDGEMNLSYMSSESESITDSAYFSAGSADLAWLCLRLALHKRLSENVMIPIILDEALVYFDDRRLWLILKELLDSAQNGTQIICFSASSRELDALPKNINCITLD